jgi:hypothetical protein
MQYFFFEVRFQFEDFVPVSRIVHSNAVLHLNVLPLKKFHNNPPKNTPNYSEKRDFSHDWFFLIETKRKKLQMRLSRSILRILQWRCVERVVLFHDAAISKK